MADSFKTMHELAEEEAVALGIEGFGHQRIDYPLGHSSVDDARSLRSTYYTAQEGTMSSRTSSIITSQFDTTNINGFGRGSGGNSPCRSTSDLSLSADDQAVKKQHNKLEMRPGSNTSPLIQALSVGPSSARANSPAQTLPAIDTEGPRRLVSEAESLQLDANDTLLDGTGDEMNEEVADEIFEACADGAGGTTGTNGAGDREEWTTITEPSGYDCQTKVLEREIKAQRERIGVLEGFVECYKSQLLTLGRDLELARESRPDLLEARRKVDQDQGGRGNEHPNVDKEEKCAADQEQEGKIERRQSEEVWDDDLGVIIEQLKEENRYLKVVFTEKISHLVAENGELRDQLMNAEQQLLELDEDPKPVVTRSACVHDFGAFQDKHEFSGTRSSKPTLRIPTHIADNRKAEDDHAIGYSPLAAGRLLYRWS